MPYLIDGFNLLWAARKSEVGEELMDDERSSANSVEPMCRIIGAFLRQAKIKGEIVFDGTGSAGAKGIDNISCLSVSFSGPGREADALIIDKIRANTAPRRLIVVSSDHKIRKSARGRDAVSVKSEQFWSEVVQQLKKKAKESEPEAKRAGLSEAETGLWFKIFGIEQ